MTTQQCPVCLGCGKVRKEDSCFAQIVKFNEDFTDIVIEENEKPCYACGGKGLLDENLNSIL